MTKKIKKDKLSKHSVLLDFDKQQMKIMSFLVNGANFLEAKYGIIPETVDRECIERVGMRLNLLIPAVLEISFRSQLLEAGEIKNPLVYFPKIRIGENTIFISEKEHQDFCLLYNNITANKDGLATFLDYFHEYCEAEIGK